jgi:NDP-sugar pyrophosphorylase family protein
MLRQDTTSIRIHSALDANRFVQQTAPGQEDAVQLLDRNTKALVALIQQSPESAYAVELYEGKGGVTAIVSAPNGLRYFALPGAKISLPGLTLEMPGDPIRANPHTQRQAVARHQVQSITRQAMILGAGLATRFEPISGDNTQYAKPSVPLVGERSVIRCIAEAIARDQFTQVFINTYYKPESLKASLAPLERSDITYIDESAPSGTAGGLRKILEAPEYRGQWDARLPMLIVQGDAVTDVNFSALMAAHLANKAAVTIGCQVVRDEDVSKFGIIETDRSAEDGQSGSIVGFMEKPSLAEAGPHRLGSTGFYIFSPEAYPIVTQVYQAKLEAAQKAAKAQGEAVPQEVLLDFAMDLFPEVLRQTQAGKVRTHQGEAMSLYAQVVEGYWCDIGNPAQYLETVHEVYAGKVDVEMPQQPEAFYHQGIIYWPGAKALAEESGAVLSGNVVVARPFGKRT